MSLLRILPSCMSVHHVCTEEGISYAETRVQIAGTICGCWEFNCGPLEEKLVLLSTETSLWPQI